MRALGRSAYSWSGAVIPRLPSAKSCAIQPGEIRSAAAWARRLLESDPTTQIGIIVAPDLTRLRPKIDRIFRRSSGSSVSSFGGTVARGLSSGSRRSADAGIRTRANCPCRARECSCDRLSWAARKKNGASAHSWTRSYARTVCGICRCPGCAKRRAVAPNCSACCGASKSSFESTRKRSRRVTGAVALRICWKLSAGRATALPAAANFRLSKPGAACCPSLASLDLTAPPMNLAQVSGLAAATGRQCRFQVEDEGAPVQVMGMLEAAGLRFDHLWIMGLHDEALPAPANPTRSSRFLCSASTGFRTRQRSANWNLPVS